MGEQGLQVAIDVGSGLIIVPWYAWNIERAESHRHLNIAPSVPKKKNTIRHLNIVLIGIQTHIPQICYGTCYMTSSEFHVSVVRNNNMHQMIKGILVKLMSELHW
jgi:hypothetical protein